MRVEGEEYRLLFGALKQFPVQNLARMVQFQLGRDLWGFVPFNATGDTIVFELIKEYNFLDQVDQLVLAARRFNPTDRQLYEVAQQFGVATQLGAASYSDRDVGASVPFEPLKLESNLRAINPLLDVKVWVKGLLETENRICRVERADTPSQGIGTAFLVGSNAVMTNYHVIKPFINPATNELQPEDLRLRFDYSIAPGAASAEEGIVYSVAKELDLSEMSPFDDNPFPPQDAAIDQLDYALLQVAGTPGDDPIGGKPDPSQIGDAVKRGWIPMPTVPYSFTNEAPLLIYQHPKGGPMKLAIETNAIEGINDLKTRVRYRTNTDPGSSGSPCFDMDWNLVALHRAGGRLNNYGVPFAAILELLKARGKSQLLG